MLTNYGQKAGSPVSITVAPGTAVSGPFDPLGKNHTTGRRRSFLDISDKELPKLIQPYGTLTLKVHVRVFSEKPVRELFRELEDKEKGFEFLYTTTTRKGQDIRTGYLHMRLPTEEGIL